QFAQDGDEIEVKGVGEQAPRRLSRLTLAEVIKPRYEELFRFIRKELHRADWYEMVAGGIVLTGGSAQMPGVGELAEEVFELPVRMGLWYNVEGLADDTRNPVYSSGVGLMLFGRQARPTLSRSSTQGVGYWVKRASEWFKGSF